MMNKTFLVLLCIECLMGPELNLEMLSVASELEGVYFSQQAVGSPRVPPPASADAPVPAPEKAPGGKTQEEKSGAASKNVPPQAFEPTEKVKADQAIDFPADI